MSADYMTPGQKLLCYAVINQDLKTIEQGCSKKETQLNLKLLKVFYRLHNIVLPVLNLSVPASKYKEKYM